MNPALRMAATGEAAAVLKGDAANREPAPITVFAYNICGAYGMNHKFSIDRTAAAITRINTKTAALNEVEHLTARCGRNHQSRRRL